MTIPQGFTWGMIATAGIPLTLIAFAALTVLTVGLALYLTGYSHGYHDGAAEQRIANHTSSWLRRADQYKPTTVTWPERHDTPDA